MHVDIGDNKVHTNFSSILNNRELLRLHGEIKEDNGSVESKLTEKYRTPVTLTPNKDYNSLTQLSSPSNARKKQPKPSTSVTFVALRFPERSSSKLPVVQLQRSLPFASPFSETSIVMNGSGAIETRQLHPSRGENFNDTLPNRVVAVRSNSLDGHCGRVLNGGSHRLSYPSNGHVAVSNVNTNLPPIKGGNDYNSSDLRNAADKDATPHENEKGDEPLKNPNAAAARHGPKVAQTKIQLGMRLKRWMIINRIGAGSFGETFSAIEMDGPPVSSDEGLVVTPEALVLLANLPPPEERTEVCIKVEQENKNVLRLEALALKKVQACPQVVRYLGSGCTSGMNFLVMEKLGPNLAELRRRSLHGNFNIYTTLVAGLSCLEAIRGVHEQGLVHRDIKPSNFVTGLPGTPDQAKCFIIDFGLARRYRRSNRELRAPRENAGFRGTSRYASVASHLHQELGRVDDLWSLLFMLVEFATGTLPWRKYKDKDDIGRCKEESIGPYLVRNLPREFQPFLAHLQTLRFEDEPDYELLLALMHRAVERRGYPPGKPVDWELDPSVLETTEQEAAGARGGSPTLPADGVAAQVESSLPPRFTAQHLPRPDSTSLMRPVAIVDCASWSKQGLANEVPPLDPGCNNCAAVRVSEVEVSYHHGSSSAIGPHATPFPSGPTHVTSGEEHGFSGRGHENGLQPPQMAPSHEVSDVAVEDDTPDFSPKEGGQSDSRPHSKVRRQHSKSAATATMYSLPHEEAAAAQSLDAVKQPDLAEGGTSSQENKHRKAQKKQKTRCNCSAM